jgi:hypothetical protein
MSPRNGPCNPWITGNDVKELLSVQQSIASINQKAAQANPPLPTLTDEQVDAMCADAAQAASEVLYNLSGKQFTGNCGPVTIRPVARPENADTRAWVFQGGGWGYGWGASMIGNLGMPPVVSLYAEDLPPYIELYDYPVNRILEVKINGVVIPPIEYELREFKWLIRKLPTPSYVATEMWGWPTSQVQYLDDTEENTFSVTYEFGQDPGVMGRMACKAMAENILSPLLGDANKYPERLTTVTRQGVTAQIASVIDIMKNGGTGIRTVDQWILSVNPQKLRKRPVVSSPDIGRNSRQQFPSRPSS